MTKNKKQNQKQTKVKKNSRKKKTNKTYKIRNWSEYNQALKQRGSLEVWIDEKALKHWYSPPTHNRGAQPVYSDLAIQSTLQLGRVFSQKLRQTEGLIKSIFKLTDIKLKVPDYSTLSRRSVNLKVKLPKKKTKKGKITIILDSSGLKVYGEGEWKVRQHGKSKRRTWRKIHLAITPDGEIKVAKLTENNISDDEAALDILDQEQAPIKAFAGDGAYDTRKVYDKCQEKQIKKILIPPQKNAKIWHHGNCKGLPHPRDENLRQIRKTSRRKWKERIGFHIRSLSETAVFRYKTIFGDRLNARGAQQQTTEVLISASILNRMLQLGMPESYAVNVAN